MEKQLPNAIEHEQSLLGSLLLYPESMSECAMLDLQAPEFFLDSHQKIYQAMQEVVARKDSLDLQNTLLRLNEKEELEGIGGAGYISQLLDGAISSANVRNYISTIKNKAQLRNLIYAAEKIRENSFGAEEIDTILDDAERAIMNVTRTRRGADFEAYSSVIDRVIQEIDALKTNHGVAGISTGFHDLDAMTSGLHGGELIILAARPAMGKSAFAMNLAENVAKRQQGQGVVAIFSLEMPSDSLIQRMLSNSAGIESDKLKTGRLSQQERECLARTARQISQYPIYIDDTSYITMPQIFSKCRKLKSEKDNIALVVIDYLQLISSSRRGDSRQQEVSEISRNLKILAKEMECPVIALSQLSRKVEERTSHEPQLSDLRESGSIEQDADIVMFLYRDSYYNNDTAYFESDQKKESDVDLVDLSIAKHRNGSIGKIRLVFEKEFSRFCSADWKTGNYAF